MSDYYIYNKNKRSGGDGILLSMQLIMCNFNAMLLTFFQLFPYNKQPLIKRMCSSKFQRPVCNDSSFSPQLFESLSFSSIGSLMFIYLNEVILLVDLIDRCCCIKAFLLLSILLFGSDFPLNINC